MKTINVNVHTDHYVYYSNEIQKMLKGITFEYYHPDTNLMYYEMSIINTNGLDKFDKVCEYNGAFNNFQQTCRLLYAELGERINFIYNTTSTNRYILDQIKMRNVGNGI